MFHCRAILTAGVLVVLSVLSLPGKAVEAPPSKWAVLPDPTTKEMVPMRDGVRLATYVWLPKGPGRFPTILVRTVYKQGIINWANSHPELYNAAGYAMVWQTTRGKGDSEGTYHFLAPDRPDGYDTVEWIAAQPWSDGNVGMDHASYLGSTQLEAAAAKPPHLKAIIPYVPAVDLWRELPYDGGIFTRYHDLNWHRLISVNTLPELSEGFMNTFNVLDDPKWLQHLTSRPVIDAADGLLKGAERTEYKAFLQHPTRDAFWWDREYRPQDYARMGLAVMLVAGNFDPSVGALTAWRGLEANAPNPQNHFLLIGPWTHGETYSAHVVGPGDPGGPAQPYPEPVTKNGPYEFGDAAVMDMFALRISFFDHYLKNKPVSVPLPNRVRVFVTGSNVWREFSTIPIPERKDTKLFLASNGHANSATGDGALAFGGSSGAADHVVSDPNDPFVDLTFLWNNPTGKYANPEGRQDVLVYTSPPLAKDITIIGEPEVHLEIAADTRDADAIVNITEIYPDGKSVRLGFGGGLRLRYREGFDREVLLTPGATYSVRIPMSYVGHTIKAGHRIRLTLSGTSFPFKDPNPNTGEKIATAVKMQRANLSIFHDAKKPAFILLPVVPMPDRSGQSTALNLAGKPMQH